MRVSLVAEEYPGSSDRFVIEEAAAMAGHEVHVVARKRGEPQLYASGGPSVTYLPDDTAGAWPRTVRLATAAFSLAAAASANPRGAARLVGDRHAGRSRLAYHAIVRHAPDRIHFESPTLALKLRYLTEIGTPYLVRVSTSDGPRIALLDAAAKLRLESLVAGASLCYATSRDAARLLAERLPIDGTVPVPRVVEVPGDRAAAGGDDGCVLVDGPVDYHAGPEYTLLALARLKSAGVAFRACFVGRGPVLRYSRYTASSLGLGDEVEWLAPCDLDEHDRRVRRAAVVVSSSVGDRLTRATWIALGQGIPVVRATVNAPARSGLVGVRRPDELAARLGDLLAAPPADRISAAARDRGDLQSATVSWDRIMAGAR